MINTFTRIGKRLTIITTLVILLIAINLKAQQLSWGKSLGGTNWDYGHSIALDGSGNVYTTGEFQGTADFNPGIGTYNLTSAGFADVFISKLDTSGNFVWAKRIGGGNFDSGESLVIDDSGNVYVTGNFRTTVDFDPSVSGTHNITSAGDYDIFVVKLDVAGNFIWAKSMGGPYADYGISIALDGSLNVITTGYFADIVDFDPGVGTYNLTSAGNVDVFVSKLDNIGNFEWAKKMGGTSSEKAYSIAVDDSGNVYTTGSFRSTADFDPDATMYQLTATGSNDDIFISKLNALGDFVWAKQMVGKPGMTGMYSNNNSDEGRSLALDEDGNVYITGVFSGTVDFDPGAGVHNLIIAGGVGAGYDIFVSKLDSAGNFVWAKNMGGINSEYGMFLRLDSNRNIYTTGYFYGTTDFDPGAGIYNLIAPETNSHTFISKLDSGGNFVWAKQIKSFGGSDCWAYSLAINNSDLYIAGAFFGTYDFDPDTTIVNNLTALGWDVFILKLSTELPTTLSEKKASNESILVYPNPFNESATIEINSDKNNGQMKFRMYDLLGKNIVEYIIPANSNKFLIHKNNLSKGMYFYSLINEEEVIETGKIVIE